MKKRESKYNPEADKRWAAKNPKHKNYLNRRSNARGFIKNWSSPDDLDHLELLIKVRRKRFEVSEHANGLDRLDESEGRVADYWNKRVEED